MLIRVIPFDTFTTASSPAETKRNNYSMVSFKSILVIQIKFHAYVASAGYCPFDIGQRHKGIQLQMSIAERNKKRLCILSMSNDPKKVNSLFSINRYDIITRYG